MIKLHHSSQTRSVRIVWLLEELGIPYELVSVPFKDVEQKPFIQESPFGKVPALQDDDVTMFESGAIVEYVLERYGEGRLAPPLGSPLRATYLQWLHFAESTAFAGLGPIIWATRVRENADRISDVIDDYRAWATAAFETLERALEGRDYVCGAELTGADVMLGYTLVVAKAFGLVGETLPNTNAYVDRLVKRAAFVKALQA